MKSKFLFCFFLNYLACWLFGEDTLCTFMAVLFTSPQWCKKQNQLCKAQVLGERCRERYDLNLSTP